MSIISFRNSTRGVVNNASTTANSKVFLPVVAGAAADCHPADIWSVHLQLELDSATLAPDFVDINILKVMYHLKVP